jgi:hypothetical protein
MRFGDNFLFADDPGVGSRDQKDVWRVAKFTSLASTVTQAAPPTFPFCDTLAFKVRGIS